MLSTTEYVWEGTKISHELLVGAANSIPVPCVSHAVGAVSRLIDARKEMRSNKDQLDVLTARACALLLVMVAPFKGKDQVPSDLQSDLEQLKADVDRITDVVRMIATQRGLRALISSKLNAEKIRDCSSQLEASMRKFDVSRHINHAVRLFEVATIVVETRDTVNKTAKKLDSFLAQGVHMATSLPSRVMPTKPLIFRGRDAVVEGIACRLSEAGSPRIAILGPGGMGKTSVALAVMEHPNVKHKFGKNCFWVPCIEATSPPLLLDILASSLQITQVTGDRLADILSELEASTDPRVVLLDNFETPWDLEGRRSKVNDYLCALANVPHLAILLTMRSNQPPSQDIVWDTEWPSLPALEAKVARQVYLDIHPDAAPDPELGTLLNALGCMPLAITLMAKVGQTTHDMPTKLLEDWNDPRIRTDLMADGMDAKTNINISVRLSVNSCHMKANEDNVTLLAILSLLPGGAQRDFFPKLAPSIANITGALVTLTKSSLAEHKHEIGSIHVQPVVRAYMLRYHPLTPAIRADIYKAFAKFVEKHKSEPGDPKFNDDARALANEEVNVQAILLAAAREEPSEDTFNALLTFCWYQCWTIPRTEVIESTVQAARAAKNDRCVAEGLRCLGNIVHSLDRYDEACMALEESRRLFQALGEPLFAARCLLMLGEIYLWQGRRGDACRAVEGARLEFQPLQNARDTAEAMLQLGKLYRFERRVEEARLVLEKTRQDFLELGHPLGAADCTLYIAKNDEREGHWATAQKTAEEARREYERLAHALNAAHCVLVIVLCQLEQALYSEALATYHEGLEIYRHLGRPLGIAQSLEGLGKAYMWLSDHNQACEAYREARKYFQRISARSGIDGAARCLQVLEQKREDG